METPENLQSIQDHSEELFNMRQELFSDRRNFTKALDMLMLSKAAAGGADLMPAQQAAYQAALEAAGLSEAFKNAAAFPFSQDKSSKVEFASQVLSEDTTQNVLDKMLRTVGESLTQEISRVVMDGLNTLASALRAEVSAQQEA
jgi:hypothetical protein